MDVSSEQDTVIEINPNLCSLCNETLPHSHLLISKYRQIKNTTGGINTNPAKRRRDSRSEIKTTTTSSERKYINKNCPFVKVFYWSVVYLYSIINLLRTLFSDDKFEIKVSLFSPTWSYNFVISSAYSADSFLCENIQFVIYLVSNNRNKQKKPP